MFLPLADAVLSTRSSSFSIMNFKTLFVIVFLRLVLTALQVVLGFHQLRNAGSSGGLYMAVFIISIVKIAMSYKVIVRLLKRTRAERSYSVWGGRSGSK